MAKKEESPECIDISSDSEDEGDGDHRVDRRDENEEETRNSHVITNDPTRPLEGLSASQSGWASRRRNPSQRFGAITFKRTSGRKANRRSEHHYTLLFDAGY